MIPETFKIRVLVLSGRRVSLLRARERIKGLCSTRVFKTEQRISRPKPDQGSHPVRTDDKLSLPSAWTCETGFPVEARIPES